MTSFNLVCHGMILFQELKNHCQILIPDSPPHRNMQGSPQPGIGCDPSPLQPLLEADFVLDGIPDRPRPATFARFKDNYLLLSAAQLEVVPLHALISMTIPRPDVLTLSRTVPLAKPRAIFGSTPSTVAVAIPSQLHDVVIFSYNDLVPGTTIRIGQWFSATMRQTTQTLCLYSQEVDPVTAGSDFTAINSLLRLSDGSAPNLQLAHTGRADDAQGIPGLGLDVCKLKNLFELFHPTVSRAPELLTDPTGCTGAAVIVP